jgi:hypothetical protein
MLQSCHHPLDRQVCPQLLPVSVHETHVSHASIEVHILAVVLHVTHSAVLLITVHDLIAQGIPLLGLDLPRLAKTTEHHWELHELSWVTLLLEHGQHLM